MNAEFTIVAATDTYWVEVSFETEVIDDSYDGHMGGYVYTFESSHLQADMDTLEIDSVTDGDGNEVDVTAVPGLLGLIEDHVRESDIERS